MTFWVWQLVYCFSWIDSWVELLVIVVANDPYDLQQAHRGSLPHGQNPGLVRGVVWLCLWTREIWILSPLLLQKERLQMLHSVPVGVFVLSGAGKVSGSFGLTGRRRRLVRIYGLFCKATRRGSWKTSLHLGDIYGSWWAWFKILCKLGSAGL